MQAVVCPVRHADEAPKASHWGSSVHLQNVRTSLFQIGPPVDAPEDPHRRDRYLLRMIFCRHSFESWRLLTLTCPLAGEKPYRCPSCPYAACRRDMITRYSILPLPSHSTFSRTMIVFHRHMRTHSRYDGQETASTSSMEASLFGSRSISVESNEAHPAVGVGPSAMDTDDDDRQ